MLTNKTKSVDTICENYKSSEFNHTKSYGIWDENYFQVSLSGNRS